MEKIFFVITLLLTPLLFAQQSEQQSLKQSNLSMLQPITVTIGGDFIVNGSFPAVTSERLDQFITAIYTEAQQKALGSLNQLETIKQVGKEVSKYALRDITLKRSNGEIVKIDLLKFRLTADFKFNPYLMNDDVIIFPSYDNERNIVDISGAVNKPTKFQFVEGDKLSDAILFAGGINPIFENVINAEISRLSNNGDKEELIQVNIKDEITLKSGDRIRVLADENQKKNYKALVLGEVKTPGYIYVKKDGTAISEVIEKAGGFTNRAWLERSELLRGTSQSNISKMSALRDAFEKNKNFNTILTEKYLNEIFLENLKFSRMSDVYAEDSMSVSVDNTLRILRGNSLIDFKNIFADSTSEGGYPVQDGDIIVIPQRDDLVYVFGQVNDPGYVHYEPLKKHDYYIRKAGGFGERAQKEIKIIKGNSYAWITADDKSKIDPGDFIYVPKNIPKPFEYYLRTIGSISTVVTAIATVILIIVQSKK